MNAPDGSNNRIIPTAESAQAALDTLSTAENYEIMINGLQSTIDEGVASVSLLQRKLGIGYGRASRLIDAMEIGGYIGPSQGPTKSREVLVTEVPTSLRDAVAARAQAEAATSPDDTSIENMPSIFPPPPEKPKDEYKKLQDEVTSANNAMDQVHEADISVGIDLDSKALDILKNLKEGVVVHLGGYRKQIPIESFKRLLLMPVKVALEENFPTDSVYMDALYEAVLDKKDHWVYEASVYKKIGAPSSKTGLHPERLFNKFRARVEAERASNSPTPHTFTPSPMNTSDNLDTSIETGERDPLFQAATEWVARQTGRTSLTDLRLALNIPAARTGEILGAMKAKDIVKQSGYMPFPQFFEYTPPAVLPVVPTPAPAAATPAPRPNPFAVRPAPDASTPRLDVYGNEWTGVDDSFSGRGKEVRKDGIILDGVFNNGFLVIGKTTYPNGMIINCDMYEGNGFVGKGKKIWNSGNMEEGTFESGALWNGTLTKADGTVTAVVNGVPVGASTPRLDVYDNEWTGVDDSFSGRGKVVYQYQYDGETREGLFDHGVLLEGKITERNGSTIEGTFDAKSGRLLNGTIVEPGIRVIIGDFNPDNGNLMNGTIKYLDDGSVRKIVNGVEDLGSSPIATAIPDVDDKSHDEPEPYVSIKSIRENAIFGPFPKGKEAEANRGIERVENLCMGLPIEDQRRIGELHIKFKDRTPPAPGGLKGLLAKKPTGVIPWRALDTNPGEGNTFVEIDPSRLPVDDSEITQYLIIAAKRYDNQLKAEMEVEDIRQEVQVSLAYDDDGKINFFKSPDGIKKIKTAIIGMSEGEKDALSRSDVLILMTGQNKEYYVGGKYRIIISCDTPMSEDQIASFLRGELRRIEQEDAAGGAPSRKPTKKSVPGIFSRTRGKIAGVLAALAVVGGGAAVVHQINKKPVPVDTTPAPKAPEAPEAAEPPKVPEKAPEEATKAPEKGPAESGEVKKVDLSKIPVGGKVSFTSPEDGVKKGVLKKNSRGKYEPVDAFDFDGDDDGTVIRIQ